jgi:pimeloyl-ACP methyl ester carboxylesterase
VSNGYVAGYHRGESPHLALTRSGYAVFAFDQIGNGRRLEEVRQFYARYPRWSLLGKMVADTRAALDALERHPRVDATQIYLAGYGTGSLLALHVGALDSRVAGVVAVGGVTSFRLDTAAAGSGGLGRWSHELPLLPRLGAFIGAESHVPYDVHELLALSAPRPVLLISPGVDYQASLDHLRLAVAGARRVFELLGAPQLLKLQKTDDYNHFTPDLVWCLCGAETLP